MKLLGLAACASAALAFSDSAPFYSSRELSPSAYLAHSRDVALALDQHRATFCPDGEELHIYRVSNLAARAPDQHSGTFYQNVHYASADDLEQVVDLFFRADAQKPVLVDLEDGSYSVDDILGMSRCVIVQGKPSFHRAGSGLDAVKEFIEDVSANWKRDSAQPLDAGLSDAAIRDAAEALVAAVASAEAALGDANLADAEEVLTVALSSRSNLFTSYQFFTPGVWLAIIVSLFLVYVVSTAVSWTTSIQTSYHSFDKQVDYEKKTE